MRVALRGLHLSMSQQTPDQRKIESGADANARSCMAKIVNAYPSKVCACANEFPGSGKIGDWLAKYTPADHVWVAVAPGDHQQTGKDKQ